MDGKAGRIPQKGDWTMKRLSISGFIWLAAIVIIIFLCCPSTSWGQTYGEADFSRRDCFTRDNLVACWNFLTPGVEGDLLQGAGDFEEWTGAEGGCTNCPAEWTCTCAGTSDINQETENIYKTDSSIKMTVDALNSAVSIRKTNQLTLNANTAYQISIKAKGTSATDDFYIYIDCTSTPSGNRFYQSTNDSWNAGFQQSFLWQNIGTDWSRHNGYITTGAETRTGCYIYAVRYAGSQTLYLDDLQLQKLKSVAPVSDTGIALEMPVTSDPSFDDCRDCQSFRGQPGDFGTTFDGTDDYLYCTNTDCGSWANPPDDFSVCAEFNANVVRNNTLASKYTWSGTDRSWRFQATATPSIQLLVSNDGLGAGGQSVNTKIGGYAAGQRANICATYDWTGVSGSSISNIWANSHVAATSAIMTGPIFATAGIDFKIGSHSGVQENINGDISRVCFYEKALSAIEANKWINPYFPANDNGPGFYVDPVNAICDQDASHATCSWDNCRGGTPDACQAEGTGVMAVFGQFTGIQDNNSFGTNTNTQDNPTFTGFTYTENAGDGTANVSQYFGESKHGDSSLRIKLTGTTSYAFVGSTCNAMLPNTDYYAYVGAKCLGGKCPTNARVYVLEYSDAGCTLNLVSNSGTMGNVVSASWEDYAVQFTSAATTNFYKIGFEARNGNADVLFDNLDLKEASHHTPWVHVPSGGGAVTYNRRDYSIHNVLTDYIQSEGADAYTTGFCLGVWLYSDWGGDAAGIHRIFNVPGTAGNNNRILLTVPNFGFTIYDGAGVALGTALAADATNWSANNWHYIEACTDNAGVLKGRHYNVTNSTWYDWNAPTGAGTGIQADQDDELEVGQGVGSNHYDGYFGPFKMGAYSATWPMYAWDKRPTKRPY